jgi:hypothetical protein
MYHIQKERVALQVYANMNLCTLLMDKCRAAYTEVTQFKVIAKDLVTL